MRGGIRRSRRTRALLAVALCLSALAAIAPAAADTSVAQTGEWCGGPWNGQAQCFFTFRGWPIRVAGAAESDGAAAVYASVERPAPWVLPVPPPGVPTPPPPIPLGPTIVACGDANLVHATCGNELRAPAGTPPVIEPGTVLACRVVGRALGYYRCSSGA